MKSNQTFLARLQTRLAARFFPNPLRSGKIAVFVTAAALLLALFAAAPAMAATYSSTGSVSPNLVGSWTNNVGGASPANFTTVGDMFVVKGGHTMSNSALWTLTGGVIINTNGVLTQHGNSSIVGSLTIDNGGTFKMNNAAGTSRYLRLNGNLTNNGLITSGSGLPGAIWFSANATWTGSGDISASTRSRLVVDAGMTLNISDLTTGLKFSGTGTMTSTNSGTLITGTQVINGNGNALHAFTNAPGSTLNTAHSGGVNGTFNWAIPVTFGSGVNFIFSGSVPQVTGTLMPATVNNLTFTNAAGVTLSTTPTTVNGTLQLSGQPLGIGAVTNGVTNLVVNALNTGGAANTVNISSVPISAAVNDAFGLISYASIVGSTNDFTLGTMPVGYTGHINNSGQTIQLVIDSAPAGLLVFTTAPFTNTAGALSGTITVQLQTSGGTPINTTSNLTVNLSTTSAGGVFRDLADTTTLTSVVISNGSSSASFRYKDTTAPATPTLTASAPGYSPAVQQETIEMGPQTYSSTGSVAPNLVGSWTNNVGGGNPANFTRPGDLFVVKGGHLMTNTQTAGTGWTNSGGVQINNGGKLQAFGTPGMYLGSLTIDSGGQFSLNGGINNRTLILNGNLVNNGLITNTASADNRIRFSGNATWTGSGDISNVRCGLVVDAGKTLNISGVTAPGLKFSGTDTMTSTNAGTLITGTQVIDGNLNASHTFTLSSGATLNTAHSGGVNGTFTNWTGPLDLGSGANYTFSGSVPQVTGTQMPATVNDLTLKNAAGVTLSTNTTVTGTLSLSNTTLGLTLTGYANAPASVGTLKIDGLAGSTAIKINSVILQGQYSLIAYTNLGGEIGFGGLSSSVQTPPVVTATLSNNVSSYPYTVDAAIFIERLPAFTTAPFTNTAGALSGPITVQLQTGGGTPINTTNDLTVNLSTTSAGGVFRNLADTTTLTSVVISNGSSSASFRYKDTTAPATPTLTASIPALPYAVQQETIVAGAATQLGFTPQPANGFFGVTLSPVVVQVQDAYGNPVPQSGTSVDLTLNGGTLASGTTNQITDGNGQATFNDLLIMVPATGLTFSAAAAGPLTGTSSSFDITYPQIVKAMTPIAMDQAASWTGGVVPGTNDIAVFNDSSVGTGSNSRTDFGADASWYGIIATNWTANTGYTISNTLGGTLTLGAGGFIGTNINHSMSWSNNFLLGTAQVWDWSGTANTLNLHGDIDNGGYLFTLGGSQPITVNGSINGAGNIVKPGTNTLTLNGTVAAGGSLTVSSGRLAGLGVINRAVTIAGVAQIAPGATALGTLTLNDNLTLNAGAEAVFRLNTTNAPATNDSLVVAGTQTINNSTITVTNRGPALVVGDSFVLLSNTNGAANFTTVNLPTGYTWTNKLAIDGTIQVLAVTPPTPPTTNITYTVNGSQLVMDWPAGQGWQLQAQTNTLGTGLGTNWGNVSGATPPYTNAIDPANPAVFYRLTYP